MAQSPPCFASTISGVLFNAWALHVPTYLLDPETGLPLEQKMPARGSSSAPRTRRRTRHHAPATTSNLSTRTRFGYTESGLHAIKDQLDEVKLHVDGLSRHDVFLTGIFVFGAVLVFLVAAIIFLFAILIYLVAAN